MTDASAAIAGEAALQSAAPRTKGGAQRWTGLDALRGIAIGSMILVNNPGDWGKVYPPLLHAKWHGCTFTDLVFPTFLFCAGASIVPALQSSLDRGRSRGELAARAFRRCVSLVLLGLFVASFPVLTFEDGKGLFDRVWNVRIPGVLQRIGVCYFAAALAFLFCSLRAQRGLLVACLVGYWPLLALGHTPDGGAPDLATEGDHLAGWLDRAVFGSHTWMGKVYDPEGLLSTIPAIGTALLGMECGRVLASPRPREDAVRCLLLLGASWMAIGAVWGWFFPINKALWTSSYSMWTAGIAASGLGLCVHAFEVKGWSRLAHPLLVYGRNALLVFVGSAVLARTLGRLWVVDEGPPVVFAQKWIYANAFQSWLEPHMASLGFALAWVASWYVVLAVLYRRGIIWRV